MMRKQVFYFNFLTNPQAFEKTLTQDGDFSEAYAVLDDIRDVIPAVEKLLV